MNLEAAVLLCVASFCKCVRRRLKVTVKLALRSALTQKLLQWSYFSESGNISSFHSDLHETMIHVHRYINVSWHAGFNLVYPDILFRYKQSSTSNFFPTFLVLRLSQCRIHKCILRSSLDYMSPMCAGFGEFRQHTLFQLLIYYWPCNLESNGFEEVHIKLKKYTSSCRLQNPCTNGYGIGRD